MAAGRPDRLIKIPPVRHFRLLVGPIIRECRPVLRGRHGSVRLGGIGPPVGLCVRRNGADKGQRNNNQFVHSFLNSEASAPLRARTAHLKPLRV